MALNSVLKQTFNDYELIVVNDASTDSSAKILTNASISNKSIKIIDNYNNIGLAKSLNIAIDSSDSKYIARFDTDDLMYPERLSTQVSYLESSDVGLLGSHITTMGKFRRSKITKYPTNDEAIRVQLLFQSAFAHPSTIFKRSALADLRYNPEIQFAEDYDLWVRISQNTLMANIDEPLLYYRKHEQQISRKKDQQNKDAGRIRLQALKQTKINYTDEEASVHSRMRYSKAYDFKNDLIEAEAWLLKLMDYLNTHTAKKHIKKEWFLCCIRSSHFGLWTWHYYTKSKLFNESIPQSNLQLKLLCISKVRYQSKVYNIIDSII